MTRFYARLRRAPARAALVLLACSCVTSLAHARRTRPRFEPTDLDLEEPATAEFDMQFGVTRGELPEGNRLVLPDFEFDLGLTDQVELDIDGAFGVDAFDTQQRHFTGEALWVGVKLGLYDEHAADHAFALGLQLGPRFPTLDARGVGYGALGLGGLVLGHLHLALNAGMLADPEVLPDLHHPTSVIGGFDASFDLDQAGRWSWLAAIGGAHYLSDDPDELVVTSGIGLTANANLDLSLVLLAGLLPGGDRAALLLGISPKTRLW